MLGHSSGDTTDIYINTKLKVIREKLDRHALRGMTFEEMFQWELAKGLTAVECIRYAQGIVRLSPEEWIESQRRIEDAAMRAEAQAIRDRIGTERSAPNRDNVVKFALRQIKAIN
jgi:hypothetical protein